MSDLLLTDTRDRELRTMRPAKLLAVIRESLKVAGAAIAIAARAYCIAVERGHDLSALEHLPITRWLKGIAKGSFDPEVFQALAMSPRSVIEKVATLPLAEQKRLVLKNTSIDVKVDKDGQLQSIKVPVSQMTTAMARQVIQNNRVLPIDEQEVVVITTADGKSSRKPVVVADIVNSLVLVDGLCCDPLEALSAIFDIASVGGATGLPSRGNAVAKEINRRMSQFIKEHCTRSSGR